MEEISQKLKSENVFLQSQSVSAICDAIENKIKLNVSTSTLYESEEVKELWKISHNSSDNLTTLAVEALVSLVKKGYLPTAATLQNFIADLASAKCSSPFIRGMTELILLSCKESEADTSFISPFTGPPVGPTHPFVLILKRKSRDLSNDILEEVEYLLSSPNIKIRRSWKSLVQPLIIYVSCLTEDTNSLFKPLISLLFSKCTELGSNELIELMCKVVSLIKVKSKAHLERKIFILYELGKYSISNHDSRLSSAILPCLITALPHAIADSLPTRSVEYLLLNLAQQMKNGCDVTTCSLAQAIPSVSGVLQMNLLRVAATLLSHRDGNPLVASRLLPSLLQIISASSSVVEDLHVTALALLSLIQSLPSQPSTNTQLSGNEFWEYLSLTFPELSSFVPAISLCNQIVRDPSCTANWLNNLSSTVRCIPKFHYDIVISVFLYQNFNSECVLMATEILEREVPKCNSLALELFPMVLYKLGKERVPSARLRLLYFLPSLAVNKLCTAMVVKTLTSLWYSSLKPLILRLMLDLWRVEPRTFAFLLKFIQDKSDTSQELEIARAYVISEIIKTNPSQYVEDLLPLLSNFLNNDHKDAAPMILIALDGIYNLCEATVIDLRTTWNMLAPKLMKDKKPEVLVRLCKLLSLTPKLKVQSNEFEHFTTEVCTLLWNLSTSKIKNSVCEAAYKALENFAPSEFSLKMLPIYACKGHKLPPQLASTPSDAARNAEDVLTYVPGLAWVKLVVGCPQNHVNYVESYIKSLVNREVQKFPKGVYVTAIQEAKRKGFRSTGGQPEPINYNFLPETSVIRASIVFLQDFSKLLSESETEKGTEECENLLKGLNILLVSLGQPLSRPFPALDWSFLNEIHGAVQKWVKSTPAGKKWLPKIREGIFRVTAQQCNKSSSALNVISKWINPSSSSLTLHDQICLFGLMDQFGRGLDTQILQTFLNHVFSQMEEYSDEHSIRLLNAIQPHLTCDYIHDNNRNAIGNALENINAKIDPSNASLYNAYKSCVAKLPKKHIERLTSPSLWWEVTDQKLYRAAILRCHVASEDPESVALPWLNDLIDSAATLSGDRSHFVNVISETLIARSDSEETTAWFLSLLGQLREYLKEENSNSLNSNLIKTHEHYQRISFYTDILVMGLVIWSGIWAINSLEKLSSSPIVRDSLISSALLSLHGRPDWTGVLPQFLNWFLYCFDTLQAVLSSRYKMAKPLLLLASLSPKLNQTQWNKIVSILV